MATTKPKPRPEKKIDVSPRAEAGDQFFVEEAEKKAKSFSDIKPKIRPDSDKYKGRTYDIYSVGIDGKEINVIEFKDGKKISTPQIQQMFMKNSSASEAIPGKQTSQEISNFLEKNNPTYDEFIKHFTAKRLNKGGTPMLEEQMELFNEGGLKDEGGSVDPVSGNDVPIGSTKKEVRDDIPAMLSEGEFVFPADVTRFIGLEKLMQQRQEAKMGLKTMEAMGQMGNSEEATMPDDLPFGPADLVILGRPEEAEPKEMYGGGMVYANQGTFATGISGTQPSVYQNQILPAAPAVPPSSVAPPTPTPAPASGFIPTFIGQPTPNFTPSTPTTPVPTIPATPSGTADDTKFVPTVEDAYTSIKYINKETGEIRDFFFYQGNPVTPIPEGFVPYNETSDSEITTGAESTATETTSVRTGGGGSGSINIPQPEKIDWSTYSAEELQDAFDKNRKTRMALTAMGAINPLIALFGQGATRMQEKEILAAMKKLGVEPPEVEGGLFSKIGSFIGGIFGQEKEEQAAAAASAVAGIEDTTVRPKLRPQIMSDEERRLIAGMDAVAGAGAKAAPPVTDEESILMRDMSSVARAGAKRPAADNIAELRRRIEDDRTSSRFERDLALGSARATRDAGMDLALYGQAMGRARALGKGPDPDALDPRKSRSFDLDAATSLDANLTKKAVEDKIENDRKKAAEDARKASKKRRDKRKKLMSDARKGKGAFAKRKQKTGVGRRNIGGR